MRAAIRAVAVAGAAGALVYLLGLFLGWWHQDLARRVDDTFVDWVEHPPKLRRD